MKMRLIPITILFIIAGVFLWYKIDPRKLIIEKSATEQSTVSSQQTAVTDPPRNIVDPFASEEGVSRSGSVFDDNLTFSTTAKWGPLYLDVLSQKLSFPISLKKSVHLTPPPANSSVRTQKELNLLLEYKKLRSKDTLSAILAEAEIIDTIRFGDYTFGEYTDPHLFPKTALLLKRAFIDVSIATMIFKKEFDRVRPSVLLPALDPVIPVPGHPAYPSGHATQLHFIAYFLSELIPEKREEFEKAAAKIAIHREIAGLHYPSDTAAGALLAHEYLEALKRNPQFSKMFLEAKEEWKK